MPESAIQHLLVFTDPVHLSELLLCILTGKVYDRQTEGEEDGWINSRTAKHSPLPDCERQALSMRGHAANGHDGSVGCSTLNWVHMVGNAVS